MAASIIRSRLATGTASALAMLAFLSRPVYILPRTGGDRPAGDRGGDGAGEALVVVEAHEGGHRRDVAPDLVDEVVQQFTMRPGVKVKIAIEIQAESATGFDDGLQRAVKENCNVLKFKNAEFESGE